MAKNTEISRDKGIEIIADYLFAGKKRKEIVELMIKTYKISIPLVDRWIKPAKEIAKDRREEANTEKRELIRETTADTVKRLGLDQESILIEYKKLAFFDLRKAYSDTNALIPVKDFDDASAAAISGIEVLEVFEWIDGVKTSVGNTVKLKLSDKKAALDSICRVLGYVSPTKIASTNKDGEDVLTIPNILILPASNSNDFEIMEGE